MSEKKLCIDLCAGLGGFSRAFKADTENWEVITIELNKKQKPTICADVRHLPLKKDLAPEVLLASPPCQRFSLMSNMWPKPGIQAALEIVGACLEAVPYLKPKCWAMENPAGRLAWFIGKPSKAIKYSDWDLNYKAQKPTHLWGNIPLPMATMERRPRTKNTDGKKHSPNFYKEFGGNPAASAKIPLGVSQAIKNGVEKKW